ncbi:MAG: signal recognition particle-docking protein FtsY [Nanoarchaeota archaeon]|nr:signal recognition particle-docking protein FtsY [Nanoarchaeota archaeon]
MFNFLKDKIKKAVDAVSEKLKKEETEVEVLTAPKEKIKEKKKEVEEEIKKEKLHEEIQEKGFFKKVAEKVTTKRISEEKFEELFQPLELALLENNVAFEVVEKIKQDLKQDLTSKPLSRKNIEEQIKDSLKKSIRKILNLEEINLVGSIKKTSKEKRPYVIMVIGYNGSGKSITCAKLAKKLKKYSFSPLLAAADTYRAAGAIQLVEYGKMIDVPVIHNPNTKDSCSVIFDAIKHAKNKEFDVVIADTSGRIHNNQNLMDELKKIARVNNPDLTILILDSLTGSDIVEQMREFDNIIDVDGIILTKVDTNEKGGSMLSATYIGKKPILYLGIGQKMDDLEEFDIDKFLKRLGLD